MNKRSATRRFKGFVLVMAVTLAIALALLSVRIERIGPELAEYGNLCGPSTSDPCYQPVLKGGFPVAYLFNRPGVSVQRKLSFFEDRLSAGALMIDIAVYFAIVLLVIRGLAHRRSRADATRSE